jgi:transketolase
VTVVAAGITLHEALKAADLLAGEGIRVRVIDLYSIKPVDGRTLRIAARATAGRVITVEDHWPEGGLGDVVAGSLAGSGEPLHLEKLAVSGMPGSGNPGQLLRAAGIDADAIARAAYALVV